MWKPPINFITLHYIYILSLGILGLIIIYPYGNLASVDAYFFGVSASTESGLNTVDVKDIQIYQQLVIYFIPILGNLGFINIVVVIVRLYWFEKRLKVIGKGSIAAFESFACGLFLAAPFSLHSGARTLRAVSQDDPEGSVSDDKGTRGYALDHAPALTGETTTTYTDTNRNSQPVKKGVIPENEHASTNITNASHTTQVGPNHISFNDTPHPRNESKALYIPSPMEREQGQSVRELDDDAGSDQDEDEISKAPNPGAESSVLRRRRPDVGKLTESTSVEHVASSMFVLGAAPSASKGRSRRSSLAQQSDMHYLSSQATIGRNSQFQNLTKQDREILGGLEYRALKLLLKVVIGYFFGLHLFGAVVLVGWIHTSSPKYRDYLKSQGQDMTWWGFYSSQTMIDNLGFTLTPDSMISFQDAQWPMIFMSFLAFAGNTLYPCLLRFVIWAMHKMMPQTSSLKEPLNFLLKHPRRCYTLLFPSRPTWILFGIIFTLNFVDVLLIIVLDLHNPVVNSLPAGPRLAAAIFQAASSRHTGTSSFNLADVNPAVQFSLLVMMYISIFPIAIAVRASNTYEEKSLGVYLPDADTNETRSASYVLTHIQNQLSFDLWYIFLGVFCIAIAEADKITDDANPAFAVFPIFFEVVSAYGNVGLSLGHPSNLTSLCGHFTPFSKLVICAMMIRGRHRGLPYQLDRAIMLPNERDKEREETPKIESSETNLGGGLKM